MSFQSKANAADARELHSIPKESRRHDIRYGNDPSTNTPNREIMIYGLHESINEDDLELNINDFGYKPRKCIVIRDKSTGRSSCYGFVDFRSIDDACKFESEFRRDIRLRLYSKEYGEQALIKKSELVNNDTNNTSSPNKGNLFYQSNDDELVPDTRREGEEQYWRSYVKFSRNRSNWICPSCKQENYARRDACYKCNLQRAIVDRRSDPEKRSDMNGSSDATNLPTNFILVRNIPSSVSESVLLQGLARLAIPVRRYFLARSKLDRNSESICYVIVEFQTHQEASRALIIACDQKLYPKGFIIQSKRVEFSYAHNSIFEILQNNHGDDHTKAHEINDGYNIFMCRSPENFGSNMRYWNKHITLQEIMLEGAISVDEDERAAKSYLIQKSQAQGKTQPVHKKVSNNVLIKRWNNRQTELNEINEDLTASFICSKHLVCFLCMKKFKSLNHCAKHEMKSQLHRENLQISEKVSKAQKRLELYGDTHNKQDVKLGITKDEVPNKKPKIKFNFKNDTSSHSSSSNTLSKGKKLLATMGWKEGDALGATNQGIAEPISSERKYTGTAGLGTELKKRRL